MSESFSAPTDNSSPSVPTDNPLSDERPPFWRTKTLDQLDPAEWESLCDGCGRCCLHKLQDEEDDRTWYTDVACDLLNLGTCQCGDYPNRRDHVPDCVQLDAGMVSELSWLPSTCAYRLVAEGRNLFWWHPLVSGDPDTVHAAGMSVRGRAIPERRAGRLDHHIITWID